MTATGAGQTGLAWVVNAYLIAFAGLLLLSGRLGDPLGRRRILVAGLTAFTAASLLCGFAAALLRPPADGTAAVSAVLPAREAARHRSRRIVRPACEDEGAEVEMAQRAVRPPYRPQCLPRVIALAAGPGAVMFHVEP